MSLPPTEPPLTPPEEAALRAHIHWRLLPLLFASYIVAYLDRINVGFAKLHLRETLRVDETVFNRVYGLGAGLFFVGYFLFEIPSNLILHRVGARLWIARIMILWGLVSAAMIFIQSTASFYAMRFLLGVAEAGFFPGVILYLTYWYPSEERGRAIALFTVGGVVAGLIGSPVSGALLALHGAAGLAGWQWLFLLEAIPAVLMGIAVLLFLPSHPRDARWLSLAEKSWIAARLAQDEARLAGRTCQRLPEIFASGRVWLLCLMYFLMSVGIYGFELWLPSIIKGFSGQSDIVVGWLNAVPYLAAAVAMVLVGRHSDRTGERRWHVAWSAGASALGFALSGWTHSPTLALAALALAFAGAKSTLGPFWALTTAFLSGSAAAGGIALINALGSLGGFVGPYVVGVIRERTGSTLAALLVLGAALLGMGLLAFLLTPPPLKERRATPA